MLEAKNDLVLKIKGKEVKVAKDDHYYTDDGNTPVIKHAPLKRIAKEFGVYVSRVVPEFQPIPTQEGIPYVAHRAFGFDENGVEISALGEAGPFNVEGIAAQFPIIMSNKRAEDRLLIALLGLEGQVYSEVEIAENVTTSSNVFPFGKHKGKTLEEIKDQDRGYLEWFVAKYKAKNPRDAQLIESAKAVLSA
ncbi:hypothetical protein JK635_07810 [Neobacillus sp. YIM B02564]|uniref:Exodeoxyribonuclease X-like C-terminal domain-containing protein n=1 Tax=Neobacillus paridis TaxID=2803862 RepID=A0ABS1TLC0_9BACI|nr:hypothetical protein [Neobacillus paridis]MBL4952115.1 hypothetical protein [Neobacillus paridis]